jgi:diguanylate cyclase (GGDEF)-like protein
MDIEIKERELNPYQLRNIKLLTHLLENDAVDDGIVELLRQGELEYVSLLDKISILEARVNIDDKTSLLKYRSTYLTTIVKTASRVYHGISDSDYYVALVRIDIDDFSVFNNRYGHDVGDTVLVSIAKIIRDSSRPTDYVIRFGGEEIDVILPATRREGAIAYTQKLLESIRAVRIPHASGDLSVTVSAGISWRCIHVGDEKIIQDENTELIYAEIQREADDALYEAKLDGKNRFCEFIPGRKDEYLSIRDAYTARK